MSRRPFRLPALNLLTLEDRTTPVASPEIRQNYIFDGPAYTNNPPATGAEATPASPSIAVGPTHTVTITNNQIQWRTIPNGSPTTTNNALFFVPGFTGTPVVWSGAKAIFDTENQRFVVAAAVRANSTGEAKVILAASDDANPNGDWIFRTINANLIGFGGNNFASDIGLASDGDAVYLTTSHYLFSNGVYQGARIFVLNKNQWFASQPTSIVRIDPSPASAYQFLQPAQAYGALPEGTGTYFVSYIRNAAGVEGANLIRIVNPTAPSPTLSNHLVNFGDIDQAGDLPDAPQSGSVIALDTGSGEIGNAVWRNNRLYFATTINPVAGPDAGQATAHWFNVDTTSFTVADQGNAGGTAGLHTFFPTVAVDVDGSLAITYSGSEGGDTVKGYYAARRFDDAAGTIRDQVEINPAPSPEGTYVNVAGTTNVWGPSTSIALDPVGRGFYAFDAFATTPATGSGNNVGRWATKGVGFSFNWAPEVIPGGLSPVVTVDEDAAPGEIDLDPAFNDYEDLVRANPALPLNFALVNNDNPGLVTVQQIDNLGNPSRDRFRLTYAPNGNGTAALTFRAIDSGGATANFVVIVSVNPQPDAPVAVADSYTTPEDVKLIVPIATGVMSNDFDPDVEDIDAIVISPPTFGTLVLNPEQGSFDYTPSPNFSGTDTFTYRVADSTSPTPLFSDVVTVTITVTPVNDAPEAEPDPQTPGAYSTTEDIDLVVSAANGVLANDSDVENDPLTAVLQNDGGKGTVTLNPDGSFTYDPDPNANGTDTFTYVARDSNNADSDPVVVTIQITPVDDVAVANDDSYTTTEDTGFNVPAGTGVLFNDQEFDGQTLTAAKLTDPANGTLIFNADGSFSYTPDQDFFGTDSFTYNVSDGTTGPSNTATVTINVTGVNDAPVAANDQFNTPEDVTLNAAAPGVRGNDVDVDGTPPAVQLVTEPANASLFVLNVDGTFTYTPNPNFFGTDTFTYKLNDGALDSNVATVTLVVTPVQDAPVAVDDAATVTGISKRINVLANDSDVDRDRLSVQSFTAPTKGKVTRSGTQLVYTPKPGASGTDTFNYTVTDGKGNTDVGTVTVTIADNVAPKVQAVRLYYGPTAYVDLKSVGRSVLPWEGVTRVDVVFSEAVTVAAGDLTLSGVTTTFGGFNGTTNTATWTFAALTKNRYSLRVAGTIADQAANPIGATWARSFGVLPGDFDGNGLVNTADVNAVKKQRGKVNSFADINGDGVVNDADVARVTAAVGTHL